MMILIRVPGSKWYEFFPGEGFTEVEPEFLDI